MNKDRIEGLATQAKGSIKEAAGKVANSPRLQAEGALNKASGKVQETAGKVKEALR